MTERDYLTTAEEAARLGGRILNEWRHKFTAREKGPANLVTEADFASERAIYEFIVDRYPDHKFLGEEGLLHEAGDSPCRWVIDPLDGTSNYVHGFPYYCVSVGLEQDGQLVAGAVYDPTRDEMYSASRGGGATLNGRPLAVSDNELGSALCMASLPSKTNRHGAAVKRFLSVLEAAQHVQRSGSAALNLCAVAAGFVDGFWSTSLKPWDVAAGCLIVMEAGGRVSKTGGSAFELESPDVLATNGTSLHESLVGLLQV